ncbi:MAG: hypothetical protein LBT91_02300 [Bifidobacteriaceae bacterium]|jgi:hypothetical protein|nr:hypothetical protein [Bifidobacteriaceae bacterium]
MNINMRELFDIKNKGIKKVEIKKLDIRKLGIWGIIFLLCTTCFISGFSINSYAASSSTVLPISRGGTNANTATQASSNILGENFANYGGILPVAKGGTNGSNWLTAQRGINSPYSFWYHRKGTDPLTTYIRITAVEYAPGGPSTNWKGTSISALISGLGGMGQEQKVLLLSVSGGSSETPYITLRSLSGSCNSTAQWIYMKKIEPAEGVYAFEFWARAVPYMETTWVQYLQTSTSQTSISLPSPSQMAEDKITFETSYPASCPTYT